VPQGETNGVRTDQPEPIAEPGRAQGCVRRIARVCVRAAGWHCVPCPAQTALGQTLTHWWQGNGSTVDSVTGQSGSLVGGTTYTSGNWGGEAFDFNGTNSAVKLERGKLIGRTGSQFTIAMWINLASVPAYGFYEFSYLKANTALFAIWNNYKSSGEGVILSFRGYEQWLVPIDLDSMVGNWNLLTVEYNGGDMNSANSFSYYLNGVQLTGTPQDSGLTGAGPISNSLGCDRVQILRHRYAWYDGLMDDIQFYNFDLSSDQVQSLVTNETLPE
jgi:hypothetical protein